MHPGAETVPLPPPEEFVVAFNRQRFAQLAIGAPIAMCVGVTYSFGLISNYMKERWDMSQGDLTTISTVANLMGMFSLPGGILFDLVGPQYALMSAMTLTSGGFILLALIFSDVVTASIPLLAFANGLTWWGTGFMDVGSLMTNLFSFPLTQGEVVIVQKTFMGLGSTFLSLIFSAFFAQGEKYVAYCYFVAGMVIFILSLGCIITRLSPYKRTAIITKKYEKCERIVQSFTGSPSTGVSDSNDAMSLATRDDETAAIQKQRGTHEESQLLGAAATTDDAVDGTLPTEEEYVKAVEYIKDRDKREAYSYYVAHTRSYLDRRRVNLSLALLWSCLIFFAAVSFANAFIEMSNDAHYALAIVGALLIASFILLLVPCKLPSLFNFGFLPSLVPVSEDAASDEEDATIVSGGVKINGDSGAGGRTSIRASRRRIAAGEATAEGQLEQGVGAVDEVNYLWMDGKDGGQPSEAVRRSMNASAARNRQPISTISGEGEPPAVAELEQLEKWLGIGPIYRGKIPCVETTFFQSLKIPIVWCFLYNSFAVWGCGSLFLSNSTQMYKSLNDGEYSETTNSLYVAIMGIASALGRVVVGYAQMKIKSNNSIRHRGQRSDLNANWEKLVAMDISSDLELSPSAKTWLSTIRPVHYDMWASITVLLPIPALMTCVATVLTITLPVSALTLPLFTSAFAFGMSWALTVLSIKEIYQYDVATMYNINFLGAMLAAIVMNRLMFGGWYDQETERQHDHLHHNQTNATATTLSPDNHQTCDGVACIAKCMLACLGINAVAAILMVFTVWWLRVKRRSDPIPAFIATTTSVNKEQ